MLDGVSLDVAEQQACCVIGPSGSGTSTFLGCINHLEKINSGRQWVDGQLLCNREHGGKLHELRPREIAAQRRQIGMMFQNFNLFPHMTGLQKVMEAPFLVKEAKEGASKAGPPAAPPVTDTQPNGPFLLQDSCSGRSGATA